MGKPAKPITLINPKTEAEYTTTSQVEANDLIYGQGYRRKEGPSRAETGQSDTSREQRSAQKPPPPPAVSAFADEDEPRADAKTRGSAR